MIFHTFGGPQFWFLVQSMQWTLILTALALGGGGVIGFAVALARVSRLPWLRFAAGTYIQLIQGIPVLMILFLSFYGLALMGYQLLPIVAAGISMAIYGSGYLAEIWRGCIQSVPKPQWEGSESLAMTRAQQYRHVILPQALRIALPPTVGFAVQVVKNTSIASLIGFVELARAGQLVNNATFQPFRVFLVVAALYFVICYPLSQVSRWLEGGSMPEVVVDGVHKSFGIVEVLKGITMSVEHGEVTALIGRSGSGKSTLLRCMNGLETIQRGSITIAGHAVGPDKTGLRRLRRDVGIVFQSYNLFPHLSVADNITLAPRIVKKTGRGEARAIAEEVLALVGLSEKFDAYPDELSGGQQQRVAIARSLAMRPKVMLFDEVTSALDPELTGEVLAVMEKLARDGMTMLLVTHEMGFARRVASTTVFMHKGRIHEAGPSRRLFESPETPEMAQFIRSDVK